MANELDVLVWGATGFTGRLVAEYLDRHAPAPLRWGIGGRSREKLEALSAGLQASPEIRIGDSLDAGSLRSVVEGVRVVVSTVGPYAQYGTPLVEACVDAGIDYCDITGEVPWIRRNVDRLHDRAVQRGSRIVHCCGFDSIPSDLGVWMLHRHLRDQHGRGLGAARFYLMRSRGGFSGGTVASLLGVLEAAAGDRELRRLLADPDALDPENARRRRDPREANDARRDERVGRWTAPFLMAAINTRVVHRTNALTGRPYGDAFFYLERMVCRSRLQAQLVRGGLGAMVALGSTGVGRGVLRRFMPDPGEGPDREARDAGFFDILLIGEAAGTPALEVRGRVRGTSDPGYGETSKMLSESALCLALDDPGTPGGVTTPAAALGDLLLDRLRAAGMTFEIV